MKDINIKTGLTDEEVIKNREIYGKNVIVSKVNNSFLKKFIESLGDPIIRILLIALGIKVIFLIKDFDWYETVGIVIAIFLASFISTISEYGSEKAFIKLQEEASKIKCRVKRNNKIEEILVEDVVKGDIVMLSSGDKIPADGILLRGYISVDESSINGESKESYKEPFNKSLNENNKLYMGSVVYSNNGEMLVTEIGSNTLYGKLANELTEQQPDSPLKIRLRELAQVISKIGYIGAILVSISYLFNVVVVDNQFQVSKIIDTITNFPIISGHILYALTLSVTIIVVAVPEGLPMMITLVLSSNMKRMLKNNVLVRKLNGIETAGNLNILFTDKTGTLTKGKMEVVGFMTGDCKQFINEMEVKKYPKLYDILKTSIIYNNECTCEDGNIIGGNMTDRALFKFISDRQMEYKKIETMPFDSKNKYSKVVINKNGRLTLLKGAPEIILKNCKEYYNFSGEKKLFYKKEEVENYLSYAAKKGMRVIALAYSNSSTNLSNLIFVGFIFIKDEVRQEAIEGIKLVKRANIQTVMITGDNKDTALSIGREVGLFEEGKVVLTSDELKNKTDDEIKKIIPKLCIVARALPQDKSRLVRICQDMNLVVGMTGDGVNDAPALKKADVGFAMGTGTEVSTEASDVVILDDNFLSIAKAVLFGRTIFKSIRKFIIFQLTVNMCAISLSIIGPFIGVDTPVTVIQMLWINMVMDTLAGLAFSFEPPLIEYMDEKPKKKDEPIINHYMKNEIFFTGTYSSLLCILFLKLPFFQNFFRDEKYFLTAFFGLFIFIGIFNCFNARTSRLNLLANLFQNKVFMFVIIFVALVQLILIYFGGDLFRTAGLTLKELELIILLSMTVVPVDWLRKVYLKKQGYIKEI